MKIALNTLEQAIKMVQQAGIDVHSDINMTDEEVIYTIKMKK